MDLFTECYKKAHDVIKNQTFSGEWEKFLKTDAPVPSLLASGGPATAHSGVADKVRNKIDGKTWRFLFWGRDEGEVIWEAAAGSSGSQEERAATLKFVRHFYRFEKRGSQDVWIYNPPKKLEKLMFDEIKGTEEECKRKLKEEKELFSDKELKHMSAALHMGLWTSLVALIKLWVPDDAAKQKVRDWFCTDHSSDVQFNAAMAKLKAGMPKIINCLNSNKLVFTDYPGWRANRASYMGGAVPGGEGGGFPVIYIEGAFGSYAGNSGMLWTCARTIVHEASHHELRTKDHKYRHNGLKPTGNRFSHAHALENADSWGCFVIDMAGQLSTADKNKFLVSPT